MVILGLFQAEIFRILFIRVWINRILPMLWLHWFLKNVSLVSNLPLLFFLPLNSFLIFSFHYCEKCVYSQTVTKCAAAAFLPSLKNTSIQKDKILLQSPLIPQRSEVKVAIQWLAEGPLSKTACLYGGGLEPSYSPCSLLNPRELTRGNQS